MKKLLISLAILSASIAHAEFFDGNTLYKYLNSSVDSERSAGIAYIAGISDVLQGTLICVPNKIRLSVEASIVNKFMSVNKENFDKSADQFVVYALKQAYPCGDNDI